MKRSSAAGAGLRPYFCLRSRRSLPERIVPVADETGSGGGEHPDDVSDIISVPSELHRREDQTREPHTDAPHGNQGEQVDDGKTPELGCMAAAARREDEEPGENIGDNHADKVGEYHRDLERQGKAEDVSAGDVGRGGDAAGHEKPEKLAIHQYSPRAR